jgi:hypothetical protein
MPDALHRSYHHTRLDAEFCVADGEPWPCLHVRQAEHCRCGHHGETQHDEIGCVIFACGCRQLRLKGSAA